MTWYWISLFYNCARPLTASNSPFPFTFPGSDSDQSRNCCGFYENANLLKLVHLELFCFMCFCVNMCSTQWHRGAIGNSDYYVFDLLCFFVYTCAAVDTVALLARLVPLPGDLRRLIWYHQKYLLVSYITSKHLEVPQST